MEKRISESGPIISVIVPHLNQPAYLESCLASLEKQTLDLAFFEVIVVDNGSAQLPTDVLEKHPRVKLLQEKRPGPGMARNRGVADAKGGIFAFIDADCRAHPDWLKVASATINGSPQHTILGGDVQIWRDNKHEFSAIAAYESIFAYRFKLYIEQHGFSGTGNLVMRRADFDKVGPFAGIDVAEDIDWGRRALEAGCRFIYVPEMIVYHPARQSMRELFVKWDRHLQHAANISDGTIGWKARWIARACAVLASPAVEWPKVVFSDRLPGISSKAKALYVLTSVRAYRFWRMLTLMNSNGGVVWNREGRAVHAKKLERAPEEN